MMNIYYVITRRVRQTMAVQTSTFYCYLTSLFKKQTNSKLPVHRVVAIQYTTYVIVTFNCDSENNTYLSTPDLYCYTQPGNCTYYNDSNDNYVK